MTLIVDGQERRTISIKGTEFIEKSGGGIDLLKPGIYVLNNGTKAPLVSEVSPSLPLNMVIIGGYNGSWVTATAPVTVTRLPGGQNGNEAVVVSVPKGVSTFSFKIPGGNVGTGIVTATISGKMINFQCNSDELVEYYLQSIYQES